MRTMSLIRHWCNRSQVLGFLALAFAHNSMLGAGIWQKELPLQVGAPVEVTPWGERASWAEGKDAGLWWEDSRDVTRVVVVFQDPPPNPGQVRLQWWQSRWPESRIPRDQPAGAGNWGWLHIGDGYQGRWREADADRHEEGRTWTFAMRPLNQKEFPQVKDYPASYRTTYKIRLLFETQAPALEALRVFTDSTWQQAELALEWGGTAQAEQVWDGHLEVFNGFVDRLETLAAGAPVTLDERGHWQSRVQGQTAGIRLRTWFVQSPNLNTFDKTIVTVRVPERSFSFEAAEVAAGTNVFAPIQGVHVRRVASSETYASACAQWQQRQTKPIYERVFDQPEQSFEHAWADMPPKRQFYLPLGCEGGRQRFGVDPDGSVFCVNDRIDRPRGKDTARRTWGGNRLRYRFSFPPEPPDQRWIEEGCLPIIHTQWERNGVRVTQTALATRLEPGSLGFPDHQADDTTVLLMRVVCENLNSEPVRARGRLTIEADDRSLPLGLRPDSETTGSGGDGSSGLSAAGPGQVLKHLVFAQLTDREAMRFSLQTPASTQIETQDRSILFSAEVPGGSRNVTIIKIPFITLDQPAELARLRQMDFESEFQRVKAFWQQRAEASCQVRTPVKEINDFYRAHVSHLLINCGREVGADRLMARVGSFGYGVFGNESCMMITDLDRRGLHAEAARCLETFLHYQGTSALPGDYLSQVGVFNGAGGWEEGGYNQHHGWIMWALAEHYRYSGDAAWLNQKSGQLIQACEWILRERRRSQNLDPKSLRGIERGLLPHGSLEDIQDWRCWLSNNLFSWWGLDAVARALADAGHPAGARLLAEAEAYRTDMLAAFKEAMVRSPLVRLSDGTFIPVIPSEVHRRGRTFGWITVTLEGPIYLIRTGALAADDPLARCIMQDYEDNLYLSEAYGYSPSHREKYWFSRGGFSMQPNLLCSPHPYLLRDEIKHYLRSYFNAFAVCFYPNTRMMTEHPLPEMGDWRGDHYKSSDESNSTYWLRLMFIAERGPELYLGQAVPRAWLADGQQPAIERAATDFGPMSLRFDSHANDGWIRAVIDPPTRRSPQKTWLRVRHPQEKPILRVELNGQSWEKFDARRELIELPVLREPTTIVVRYPQ